MNKNKLLKDLYLLRYWVFVCCRKKSFLFSALYAAFIFGGRHLMNKRAKFELRKPLVLWSLTLAVFRWVFLQFPNAVHPFHQTWLKEAN